MLHMNLFKSLILVGYYGNQNKICILCSVDQLDACLTDD